MKPLNYYTKIGARTAVTMILLSLVVDIICLGQAGRNESTPGSVLIALDNNRQPSGISSRSLTASIDTARNTRGFMLNAWNNECRFKIDTDQYSRIYQRSDDNLEWEIILSSSPQSNILEYSIETRGLRFYYQPPLTPDEMDGGAYRPDSVVGSYAVYHDSKRNNRMAISGTDTTYHVYRTGKAFHIYAPYAWDLKGDTIKCSLHIDLSAQILAIVVPQKFLDRADYPVTVDPQFGKTDIGATQMLLNPNYSGGSRFTLGNSGTADSIVVYVDDDGTASSIGGAIYGDDSGCNNLVDTSVQMYSTSSDQWYQMKTAMEASLSGSTDYWILAFCGTSGLNLRYDSPAGETTIRDHNDPWPPGDPCNNPTWTYSDRLVSMYVTYTVSGETEPGRRRSMILKQGE
jgi:hypothetical protein